MKCLICRILDQTQFETTGSEQSSRLFTSSSWPLLLLPTFPYQITQLDPLNIILVVSIVFLILAGAIGVFLLLLVRRSRRRKPEQAGAADTTASVEAPAAVQVGVEPEVTIPSPAISDEELEDTSLSLPTIEPVSEPSTLPISGLRPKKIGWQIAGLTDVGLKRELNEDSLRMIEADMDGLGPYGLYIVADGLGGHEAGEVASQLTVDALQQRVEENPPTAAAAPFEEWLNEASLAANEVVLERQEDNSQNRKMGSTLIMALVADVNAHIVNVGDSRAYHLSNQSIKQISVDHSLVERLVQIGQITREEARTHKQRNVIYSTIGEKNKFEIGFYHIALDPGDRLLLCSDGLSGMLTDEELLNISQQQSNPAKAAQGMIEAAKKAGGHDNITAIIIQMNEK